ncbi:TIGR02611 family protein [Kineococcus gynurae]|uniref:TIGR02611 family protein n=1 Tax=Kineococcus gynurae TaxID=452979 RepID=A0ABV5LUW1_9ACTN
MDAQSGQAPPAAEAARADRAGGDAEVRSAARSAEAATEESVASPRQRSIRRRRLERFRHVYRDRRERLRADAHKDRIYRTVVGVLGSVVVVVGLALVPLPGPGWLIVFLGLALLGTEFHWARRLHAFGRRQLHAWTAWLGRRSWTVRVALASASAVCVGALVYGYLVWAGIPGWTPEFVRAELRQVPGLQS